MPPSSRREPTIELRRHRRTDGSESELWSVRWYDAQGRRRRRSCGSREEADFERARLALNASRPRERGSEGEEEPATLLREFWPLWLADARSRLQPETARAHERVWSARLQPAFGDEQLRAIKPRMVARWRAELLETGSASRRCARRWCCCRRSSPSRSSGARPTPTRSASYANPGRGAGVS